jgi:two-component system, NarL family, invasion response regulator UvrY
VISILIVDEHAVTRRGIRQTLAEEFRDVTFGEARGGDDAMRVALKRPWDLITIETCPSSREPNRDPFDALEALRRQCPSAKVLVVSGEGNARLVARAMQLGASAYLSKSAPLSELRKAIRMVLAGGAFITRDLVRKKDAASRAADGDDFPRKPLSRREREILSAICSGKSESELAAELGLDIRTISTYKRRTMNKLRLSGTASLIRYALDHGLA